MGAGKFVLENQNGEVVRTFALEGDTVYIVYRHDLKRVEILNNLKWLEENDISFDLVKKTSASSVMKRAISFNNGARFRFTKEIERITPSLQIKDDSEEQENAIYKYTALTQVGALALIFIIGLLIEPLFMHKQEDQIVTVIPQEFVQKRESLTVKAAEHKIDPVKHVAKKKVESHVKEVPKTLTTQRERSPTHQSASGKGRSPWRIGWHENWI
jgi:hypothetical protein